MTDLEWVRVSTQGLFKVVKIKHPLVLSLLKDGLRWFDKLTMSGGREKALLLRRRADDYLGGIFEIPSGAVEEGETLLQALERETVEEIGLSVIQVDGYLGAFEYPSQSGQQTRQLSFRISVHPSAVVLTEHETFVWANKADLDDYPLSEQTRELVRQAL